MDSLLLAIILAPVVNIIVWINFISYLFNGRILTNRKVWVITQLLAVIIIPAIFLYALDLEAQNDCCSEGAVFAPEHRMSVYFLIILYSGAFIVGTFRQQILSPIPELLQNVLLVLGLVLNGLFLKHFTTPEFEGFLPFMGNIPIMMVLMMLLAENHKLIKNELIRRNDKTGRKIEHWSLTLLNLPPLAKYPAMVVLLVPVLIFLLLFLLVFGQQPDSIIRAFTDTYKHGFSQLDYKCANVDCGGHFLCAVGANGHKSVVKPVRYGERHGKLIVCNRQLLIANAFEDWIQEKFPSVHKVVRTNYNRVGLLVHRHYHIFSNKFISDGMYILMKPAEILFLFVLYTFDKEPENRIAVQYLKKEHRELIKAAIS